MKPACQTRSGTNANERIARYGRMLLSALTLAGCFLLPGAAHAARSITSATLNGAASVTVTPGATISAVVNVTTTTTGSSSTNDWRSTGWRIATSAPGGITCVDHANHNAAGNYSETFNITAPTAAGTYNVYFIAYRNNDCDADPSPTRTMSNAVVVATPPPTVVSINRAGTSPTTPGASVSWTVVFDKSVTGVDAADFALVQAGGVSGAAITSVSGSSTTWTVAANTGSGTGSLGLNLVDNDTIADAGGRKLGGTGTGNGNFTGQVYAISSSSCLPPSNIPAGLSVSCVCDTFARTNLNPSPIFGANWITSASDNTGIVPSIVNPGYLRLTSNTNDNAKAVTVPGIFPAVGNYISVEFKHYAYNGSGADGIAVTLSDYSVPPVPGAFGGSLGYAPKKPPAVAANIPGFAGGWIGVAIDEYGNFQNPTEGRTGGPGAIPQSVGIRGSGSGVNGYGWLAGTAGITPSVDDRSSTSPSRGNYYQVIVDARVPTSAAVAVNRDTGSGYTQLISIPNIYSAAAAQGITQAAVPANWQISFTGSTGGATNIHEIGSLRVCAQNVDPPSGGTANGFSVIDEGYGTPPSLAVQNYLNGHLFMKVAATPFKLNVAALDNSQIQTSYASGSNKSVTVKLVDNSDGVCILDNAQANYCNAGCTGKAAVRGGSQTLTFTSSDNGQKQSASFTLNSAYRKLAAIVSDGTVTACGTDEFSVRPASVASVTSSNATNAGTTGAPIFKAGSDKFALTASTISGYTGTLKINNAAVAPVKHAAEDADPVAGVLAPSSFPAAISGTPSSTATGAAFTYSEVGTFVLAGYDPASNAGSPRGVFDGVASATECNDPTVSCENLKAATWTGVDSISAKGDCIADSYANVKDGNGKYGCNFGITQNTAFLGRFIPYRFALSGSLRNRADMAACGDSGFTYFGEQINAIFTLTAQAADGTTTKNYAGVLAKLDPTDFARLKVAAVDRTTTPPAPAPQPPYLLTPRISTLGMPAGSCGTSCFAAGVAANITASFMFARAAPEGAYAKVDVGIDPADDDGVTVLFDIDTSSATNAPLTPDRGKIGRTELRYGRLRIDNAYGSELLRLPVSLEAQYWNGNAYVRNVDDDCTPLAGAKFSLSKHTGGSGGITTANMNIANVVGGDPLSNGAGKIALNAPTPAITRKGSVELRSEIPYLPGAGRETFGVYKAGPVIYVREIY